MFQGGGKSKFFSGEWFYRSNVYRETLQGGFSHETETGCVFFVKTFLRYSLSKLTRVLKVSFSFYCVGNFVDGYWNLFSSDKNKTEMSW